MASGLNAANIIGEIMEAVGFTALGGWLASVDAMFFRRASKLMAAILSRQKNGRKMSVRLK